MKIDLAWKRECEGVTEIEVDENEVLAWLNDPVTGGEIAGTIKIQDITPEWCVEWLKAGEQDVWEPLIDFERDVNPSPYSEYELEGLA